MWYQLDVEVGRAVDVGHHSVDLCVEFWIDGRGVEHRVPAILPWRMKPMSHKRTCQALVQWCPTVYHKTEAYADWSGQTVLNDSDVSHARLEQPRSFFQTYLATSTKTRNSATEMDAPSLGTFLRSTSNSSVSWPSGLISRGADPTRLWNSVFDSLHQPIFCKHKCYK